MTPLLFTLLFITLYCFITFTSRDTTAKMFLLDFLQTVKKFVSSLIVLLIKFKDLLVNSTGKLIITIVFLYIGFTFLTITQIPKPTFYNVTKEIFTYIGSVATLLAFYAVLDERKKERIGK